MLAGTFTLTDNVRDADYGADILNAASGVSARYVRFEILSAYADPNGVIPPTASLGEVAFSVGEAIPEPATFLFVGAGLAALRIARRQ
jgi:hypothetical protein